MDQNSTNLLVNALNGFTSAGASMAGNLVPTGLEIFGVLVGIRLLWMWLQYMLMDRHFHALAGRLVFLTIRIGIVGLLLSSYLTGAFSLKTVVVDGSNYLSQKLTGMQGDSIFSQGATQINGIIAKLDTTTFTTQGAATAGGVDLGNPSSGWDTASQPQQGWFDAAKNWFENKLAVFTGLMSTVIFGVAEFALVLVLVIYTGTYMVGTMMMYIGIAFGPFFIPWWMLENVPVLSSLPEGWFKFTLSASLYKVVAAVMIAMMGGVTDALTGAVIALNQSGHNAAGYDIAAAIGVLLFAILQILILFQVPAITNGLLSGNSRVTMPFSKLFG